MAGNKIINIPPINNALNGDFYTKKLPSPELVYVIDFFCGCGGMSWGFSNTRQSHLAFKVLGGIDIDEHALKTYAKNIEAPAILRDIKDIADKPAILTQLLPNFDPKKGRPLVFIGCAPCQGFSAHRKKDDRDDPRNNLMIAFAKICKYYKPDFIVIENVPEILNGRFKKYYESASEILKSDGYFLSEDILDLSLYGVPQRRRRAVIIGATKKRLNLPPPVFTKETALTVRHAISHLRPVKAGNIDPYDPNHQAPNHTKRIVDRIKKTPVNGGDRRALSESDQLGCHTAIDNGKTPGFTDVYGRLRWDSPSVTLTAKCSTPSCGRFVHPEQHRNISIREAGIIQGFPQSYEFIGPLANKYRQIGEAVPPLFARFLAWQILDSIRPNRSMRIQFPISSKDKIEHHSANLSVVDCFCGAGGLALGFKAADYNTKYAFDTDTDCISTFRKNISKDAEVRDIEDELLPKTVDQAIANDDFIILGGPPCQGFSQQRRGTNKDPRNNLVLKYSEFIFKLKKAPLAIILENVTYLDSPRGTDILNTFIKRIESGGYRVFRHDLNSADYGVPQLRQRIVIVAIKKNLANQYAGPTSLSNKRWSTINEVFRSLPDFDDSHLFPYPPNHTKSNEGSMNKRRIAFVDMGKGRLSIPPDLQLECHRKYGGHLDVYGRLDWFSQARTITGGFDSFTRGEYGHPFFHRSITQHEGSLIQGFPDWFRFIGNRSSVRRQIGNAVPPLMAYALASGIKNTIKVVSMENKWAN